MEWIEEFSVGIPEIDAQHRNIVDCITMVEQAVGSESRWSAVHSALVVLNKYVNIHFAVEESLLHIHGYPDLDRHVLEHRRLAEDLSKLQQQSLKTDISDKMVAFLNGWLRDHILTHDKDYAWYVPQVGVKHPDSAWTAWSRRWRALKQHRAHAAEARKTRSDDADGSAAISRGNAPRAANVERTADGLRPDEEWMERWESELARRERELHEAQRLAGMGSWTWNLVDGAVTWSENLFRIFGLDPAGFTPSPEGFFDLVHAEDRQLIRDKTKSLTEHCGQQSVEIRIVRQDGTTRWISAVAESVADPFGKVVQLRGITTDITARVELAQHARAADQHLRSAVESLDEYFLLCDPQDRIAITNRRWRELNSEVASSTLPGTPFQDHLRAVLAAGLIPEAIGHEEDWLRQTMRRHRQSSTRFELHLGDRRVLMRRHRLDDGSSITVGMDITDLKRVELAIRHSEERIASIVDTALHAIVSADEDHRIVRFNLAAENVFGYSASEVMGMSVDMVMPQHFRPTQGDAIVEDTDPDTDADGTVVSRQIQCRRRDGSEVPLRATIRETMVGGKREYTIMLHAAPDPAQRTTQ